MTAASQYRSHKLAKKVIAFSVSYQPENLLARGMGFEHLNELLIRLARPILRQGADLAYGGNWEEAEGNFTFPLLRLISAENEDIEALLDEGRLYNHSAWPHYLKITATIEAQWINCCSIVRITQQLAGIAEADVVPDADAETDACASFNAAVTLSAMRRLMMMSMSLDIPDVAQGAVIPPVVARILLGGKAGRYSGFLPGIFEEALVTLQHGRPTYLLGGFGGAAEILARAMLAAGTDRPDELTLDWHLKHNPDLASLVENPRQAELPTEKSLDALFEFVLQARGNLAATLHTGLSETDTRELLATQNVANAVHLVRVGLASTNELPLLPA